MSSPINRIRPEQIHRGDGTDRPDYFLGAHNLPLDGSEIEWPATTAEEGFHNLRIYRNRLAQLRPEPTDPPSMEVVVHSGQYTVSDNSETISVGETVVGPLTVPSSGSRIDVLSIRDDGSISVTLGNASSSPSVPNYPEGEMAIAEVKTSSDTTAISDVVDDLGAVDEGIRDVRPFLNLGGGSGSTAQFQQFEASDGQRVFTVTDFSIRDDAQDILTFRNTGFQVFGSTEDYVVNGSDIVFNFDLSEGEMVTVVENGASDGGSLNLFDDEGTVIGTDPSITTSNEIASKSDIWLWLDGVKQRPSEFTFNAPDEIVLSGEFTEDVEYHVKAQRVE